MKQIVTFLCMIIFSLNALSQDKDFHPPTTQAEKTLDKIIKLSEKDPNIYFYLVRMAGFVSSNNYDQLFSNVLVEACRTKELEMVKENCAGKYSENEICGLDFSPVTCTQDGVPDYMYKTLEHNNNNVIIQYKWPDSTDAIAKYKMIKQNDVWILDGIECINYYNIKFNMP